MNGPDLTRAHRLTHSGIDIEEGFEREMRGIPVSASIGAFTSASEAPVVSGRPSAKRSAPSSAAETKYE